MFLEIELENMTTVMVTTVGMVTSTVTSLVISMM